MQHFIKLLLVSLSLLGISIAESGIVHFDENRVTFSTLYENAPSVGHDGSGYIVVYEARALLPNGTFDQSDVYYQRIISGQAIGSPYQVTLSLRDDYLADISGNHIVYTSFLEVLGNAGTIILYTIATGQSRALGGAEYIQEPRIHGHNVAWVEGPPSASFVVLFDIDTGERKTIAGPLPPASSVEIGDKYIVWSSRERDYDIQAYDLETGGTFIVTDTSRAHDRYPATSGDWIVWQTVDEQSSTGRIDAYNVRSGELRTIMDGNANEQGFTSPRNPHIDGDIITYEAMRNDPSDNNLDVFAYSIADNETYNLTDEPGDQHLSNIFGNSVAYTDSRFGDDDIYVTWIDMEANSDIDGDQIPDLSDPCPSNPANTCDPAKSGAAFIDATTGGSVTTQDGSVVMEIPGGALTEDTTLSITHTGTDYELSTNLGEALAVFGVDIQPEGTIFAPPATLVFRWDDADNDGWVDNTNVNEENVRITKDNVAVTGLCKDDIGCDPDANTFGITVTSLSVFAVIGPLDSDNDGVYDNFDGVVDACPYEDATGFDADINGCIDSLGGLVQIVNTLVNEEVISIQMKDSLLSKIKNVQASAEKDNICAAVNELGAFKNQIEAQRGKKISDEAATLLINFADNLIALQQEQLLAGDSC